MQKKVLKCLDNVCKQLIMKKKTKYKLVGQWLCRCEVDWNKVIGLLAARMMCSDMTKSFLMYYIAVQKK